MSADDQAAVQEALRAVRVCGEACAQPADLDAAKAALAEVRFAAIRAFAAINAAEANTRNAALAKHAFEYHARLEREIA